MARGRTMLKFLFIRYAARASKAGKRNRLPGFAGKPHGLRLFLLSAGLFLLLAPIATAEDGLPFDYNLGPGVLQMRSQSPTQSIRLSLPSVIPGDFGEGWSVMTGASWTNVWSNEREFLLDYEMMDVHAAAAYAVNKRLHIGLFFDERLHISGAMDGFIEGFHDFFGIGQDGRDLAKNGQTRVIIRDKSGNVIVDMHDVDRMDNQGIGLLAQVIPFWGNEWLPAVGLYGIARYALNHPSGQDDSDRLNTGFGLGLSKRLASRWYAYGSMGYAFYGQTVFNENGHTLELKDRSLSGSLAFTYNVTPSLALILQYIYNEATLKNCGGLSEDSHEFNLGVKWRFRKYDTLEFSLIENFITYDNSPDFGLHLAYAFKI